MYSDNMKFTSSHEWVKLEADDTAIIGITAYAQELLGDLVYIELPGIGQQIKAHDTIGVVESVKAASDLYSPVSGIVTAVNSEVVRDPALANSNPHGLGWLIKVKLDEFTQLNDLMSAAQYKKSIEG